MYCRDKGLHNMSIAWFMLYSAQMYITQIPAPKNYKYYVTHAGMLWPMDTLYYWVGIISTPR